MREQYVTCTVCPMGCRITVRGEGDRIESIEGFTCKRGERYARDEFLCPKRTLTTTVRLAGSDEPLLAVRSSEPVPRDRIAACMEYVRGMCVAAPVQEHQVLLEDIAGTGAALIACRDARAI